MGDESGLAVRSTPKYPRIGFFNRENGHPGIYPL